MIYFKSMTDESFENFKNISQQNYANDFSIANQIQLDKAVEFASLQFDKLLPNGRHTSDQIFFDAFQSGTENPVGYLWFAVQTRFEKTIMRINDIFVNSGYRRQGVGTELMVLVQDEAKRCQVSKIQLHVFHHNEAAKQLYSQMGFTITDLDMQLTL